MSENKRTKKQSQKDWHKADIKAALEKAGWSLRRLTAHHGYKSACVLKDALAKPWPKGERLIASAIGKQPSEIWPSRYDEHGQPNRPMGRKPKSNNTTKGALA